MSSLKAGPCLIFNPTPIPSTYVPSLKVCVTDLKFQDAKHFYPSFLFLEITWKFEEDIIDICFEILNRSLYFLENPSKDYSQRNDPVYVCRVVSAMVRTEALLPLSEDNLSFPRALWKCTCLTFADQQQ